MCYLFCSFGSSETLENTELIALSCYYMLIRSAMLNRYVLEQLQLKKNTNCELLAEQKNTAKQLQLKEALAAV